MASNSTLVWAGVKYHGPFNLNGPALVRSSRQLADVAVCEVDTAAMAPTASISTATATKAATAEVSASMVTPTVAATTTTIASRAPRPPAPSARSAACCLAQLAEALLAFVRQGAKLCCGDAGSVISRHRANVHPLQHMFSAAARTSLRRPPSAGTPFVGAGGREYLIHPDGEEVAQVPEVVAVQRQRRLLRNPDGVVSWHLDLCQELGGLCILEDHLTALL